MNRIAVFNQKGGVAKTTTALNLSAALHQSQLKNCLIDMDPQGHLTSISQSEKIPLERSLFDFYLNNTQLSELVTHWEHLGDLIPSHAALVKVDSIFGKGPSILNKLKLGLDTLENSHIYANIIMDCCPHLGVLSLNSIFAADLLIVPVSSDFLSLRGAEKVEKTLKALERVLKKRVERRYVLTMFDNRRKMAFEVLEKATALFGEDLCKTVINMNVALAESPNHQQDIFHYQSKSKGAKDYAAFTKELISANLVNA